MKIGTTIRTYRLQKGLSQGDIEKKTGLLRCYLSRVENGHTVPSLDTLSKIALALDIPIAQFFADDTLLTSLPRWKIGSWQPPRMAAASRACSSRAFQSACKFCATSIARRKYARLPAGWRL
jgi:transcriptional regulator with XRE-family HTH domain